LTTKSTFYLRFDGEAYWAKCPEGTINKMPPEAAQKNKREEERRKREGKRERRENGRSLLPSISF
jgi:hypothetical protein